MKLIIKKKIARYAVVINLLALLLPQLSLASESLLTSQKVNTWIKKWTDEEKMPFLMGVLANVDNTNHAKSRTVAIREISDQYILFFTQKGSSKVAQLKNNKYVSMTIMLPDHKRQIIYDGIAEPISTKDNIAYWKTYPKGAQIRFLAYGPTSGDVIDSNKKLDDLVAKYKIEYANKAPAYPESYVGYKIYPSVIKLYQMNDNRMSDSYILKKDDKEWQMIRVVP
ncbi:MULTISPECIES: pyridoxamine 5'-phosphate oxidase family protein [Cysteiniphilum]|uniref:Pyridoxamine 5'-phosphate oxidase n=1 Tax=Cysteiniphilum litorale TaxID=2056700 RepID=A0A8J3E8E5_9GAMM|nr:MULTISPECIES: pyridoxamine 5'-phosphate oxidase family protein [Cysteiniphilum]GGF92789.1 pyridoxamine 5'-phosphate oxidase [Cysteiniphilum litorale]